MKILINKSVFDIYSEETIQKSNEWGRKIPIKKQTSDGRMITYWVSPEEMNQGRSKGQMDLFGDNDINNNQEAGEDDYFNKLDKDTYELKVKPLVREIAKVDEVIPGLSKRIEKKYEEYEFDRETRDLDIQLDFDTAAYMQHVKKDPENQKEYYSDYIEKTNNLCKKINNRKMAMSRLSVNSKVKFRGKEGKITEISDRGYPVVKFADGTQKKCFVDEIADIKALAEKYKAA